MPTEDNTQWVVELDIGARFLWRPEMTCLKPIEQGKLVCDLQPGDRVWFNSREAVVTEFRPYR